MTLLFRNHSLFSLNERGAALPIVLFFSIFAFIIALGYLFSQRMITKPVTADPVRVQALLNARSGIWRGATDLANAPTDSVPSPKQNQSDPSGENPFPDGDLPVFGQVEDSLADELTLYSSSDFGTAQFSSEVAGCYRKLTSIGIFRQSKRTVTALMGGTWSFKNDTVLLVETPGQPQGGSIVGEICFLSATPISPDTGKSNTRALSVRKNGVSEATEYFVKLLTEKDSTLIMDIPQDVRSAEDFELLPEVVKGHLLINDMYPGFSYSKKRRICVMGDLQFTGGTTISNVEFIVSGDIKVFDRTSLNNVSLFAKGRVSFDGQASFRGTILTMGRFSAGGKTTFFKGTVVTVAGSDSKKPTTTPTEAPADPVSSIALVENVDFTGSLIAINQPGNIKIDEGVIVKGCLFTQGNVCMAGKCIGVVRCKTLVDFSADPNVPPTGNQLTGSIKAPTQPERYLFPFFMGKPMFVSWEEQ